jgi:hypothetical protein
MRAFQVRPTSLAGRLRYTEDASLREKCAVVERMLEPEYQKTLETALASYKRMILYGNGFFQIPWAKRGR